MSCRPQLSTTTHLDLTLPLAFVIEWTKLSAKHTWIAHTADDADTSELVSNSQNISLDVNEPPLSSERSSFVLETNSSVLTTPKGERKTYLCARFTGLQLHHVNGKLQLNVVNITSGTSENISNAPAEPSGGSNLRPSQDHKGSNHAGDHTGSPETSSGPVDSCADQGLLCSPVKPKSKSSEETEVGVWDGSCSRTRKNIQGAHILSIASIEPEPVAVQAVSKEHSSLTQPDSRLEQEPKTAATSPSEDTGHSTQCQSEKKQNTPLTDSGGTQKRKRGRPRKTYPPVKNYNSSGESCNGTALPSDKLIQHPPNRGRYSLRGKKLPSSIFGDSGSEGEPEHPEEDEYFPPSWKCAGDMIINEKICHSGSKENLEPLDLDKLDQSTSVKNMSGTDLQAASPLSCTTDSTILGSGDSVQEKSTSLSSQSAPGKRKRGRPPHRKHIMTASQPSSEPKKERMKIDVSGLPSFARRQRNKDRKALCRYCSRKFCDYTGVMMHVKKFHAKVSDLSDYLSELRKLSVVKCSRCEKQFDNRFQLQLHEDKVHFKAGEMQCGQCGKSFANMVLVKQHIRSVHHVQGQGHACTLCPARFKWATTLKTHIAEVHHGIRNLACSVCGKKFHRRAQLNRHARSHEPEDAKLACHICGRKFSYSNNLQRHMTIVHGPQDEAWHCAYCGKGFQRKESLHNHVEKVHFALFPYHCLVCRAGFIRAILLEKHMRAEHGQADFQAPVGRRAHFKYNRSEGDELVCSICEEKFFYKAQLVNHMFKAHREAFPFECEVCQQVFMEKPFLIHHRKRAHAIQPESGEEDLDVEQGGSVMGMFAANVDRKRCLSLIQAKAKERKATQDSDVGVTAQSSYIIKVENGDNMIEYVIQNPEAQQDIPPDAVVQNIANLLMATEQPAVEETQLLRFVEDGVTVSGNTVTKRDFNADPDLGHTIHEDISLNEGVEQISVLPQEPATSHHRIFVQCGDSIHELVPGPMALGEENIQKELSASNENVGHGFEQVSTPLLALGTDSRQQEIIIAGPNMMGNSSVEGGENVAVLDQHPLGSVSVQPACVSYSNGAVDQGAESTVFIAVGSMAHVDNP